MPLQGAAKDPKTTTAGVPTALTDNSGGTAADTIAAIGGTYNQAEVRNAVASLAAKVNALQALLDQMSEGRSPP